MNRLGLIKTAYTALAAFVLAACASDEPVGGTVQDLPEGKYPLMINAVNATCGVQTRVSENTTDGGNSSVWDWDGNEQIGVQLYKNGNAAAYTLNKDTTISTSTPLYWNSTDSTAVYAAWYPYADGEIDLTQQDTQGLPYVMKGAGNGDYRKGVSLTFTHQLAKVRVRFAKEGTADMTNAKVYVMGYPSCSYSKGNVTHPAGQQFKYLPMKRTTYTTVGTCYEANIVPGLRLMDDPFLIEVNGKKFYCPTAAPIIPAAGDLVDYTLTIDNQEINLSDGNDISITDNGTYTITGSGAKPINIKGSPTIYLDSATVAVTDACTPAVNITGGSPTIYVKGMGNSLTSFQYGGIIMSDSANLKITGEGRDACKLTVKAGTEVSADKNDQFSFVGIGVATNRTCGSITIENVWLDVTGGKANDGNGGCAAIGTSGPNYNTTQCGDIYINDARINAKSGAGAAAIGTGNTTGAHVNCANTHLVCGNIKIKNSILSITVMPFSSFNYYGAGIGTGCLFNVNANASTKIGNIIIDCEITDAALADAALAAYTEDFKLGGNVGNSNYKIGWGYHSCNNNSGGCSDHTIVGFWNLNETTLFFGWKNTWECREEWKVSY